MRILLDGNCEVTLDESNSEFGSLTLTCSRSIDLTQVGSTLQRAELEGKVRMLARPKEGGEQILHAERLSLKRSEKSTAEKELFLVKADGAVYLVDPSRELTVRAEHLQLDDEDHLFVEGYPATVDLVIALRGATHPVKVEANVLFAHVEEQSLLAFRIAKPSTFTLPVALLPEEIRARAQGEQVTLEAHVLQTSEARNGERNVIAAGRCHLAEPLEVRCDYFRITPDENVLARFASLLGQVRFSGIHEGHPVRGESPLLEVDASQNLTLTGPSWLEGKVPIELELREGKSKPGEKKLRDLRVEASERIRVAEWIELRGRAHFLSEDPEQQERLDVRGDLISLERQGEKPVNLKVRGAAGFLLTRDQSTVSLAGTNIHLFVPKLEVDIRGTQARPAAVHVKSGDKVDVSLDNYELIQFDLVSKLPKTFKPLPRGSTRK